MAEKARGRSPITHHRNNKMALVFNNYSTSSWRDLMPVLYPKGKKSVGFGFQVTNGWVVMSPDPNHGFTGSFGTTLSREGQGIWMSGDLSSVAAANDVKISRILMGHRFWHVATGRVWSYRVLFSVLVMAAALFMSINPLAAAPVAALSFFLQSPCTPRGLRLYAEKRGFAYPMLAPQGQEAEHQLPPLHANLTKG